MTMTEIEARGKIKYRIANEMRKAGENKEEYEDLEIALQVMKEIREYRELGTVEELQELKEKSVAKKPIDKIMYLECPSCGDVGILDCGYCSVCGQKLDWE